MGGLSTRRFFAFGLAAAGAVPLASQLRFSSANAVEPAVRAVPIAPVVPKTFKAFGGARLDNYDWLRDRKDPRVVSYLDAENAYAGARLEPIKPLVDELAAEMKAREAQEDASVPATYNGYVYQHRFSQGAQYPCIVRHKDAPGAGGNRTRSRRARGCSSAAISARLLDREPRQYPSCFHGRFHWWPRISHLRTIDRDW